MYQYRHGYRNSGDGGYPGKIRIESPNDRYYVILEIDGVAITTMLAARSRPGFNGYGNGSSLNSAHTGAAGRLDGNRLSGNNTAMAAIRWAEVRSGLGDAKTDKCCHQQLDNHAANRSLHHSAIIVIRNRSQWENTTS